MSEIIVNGVKTRGFIHPDVFCRIPVKRKVCISDTTYFVGYWIHSEFHKIYECELLSNASMFLAELSANVSYPCCIVKFESKVSML